jgi:hypothetical protein
MEVRKTRHVDTDEAEDTGFCSYYYEYDIYEFVQGEVQLIARSYTDAPQEAHFLGKVVLNQHLMLTIQDFSHPLMSLALERLKADGKSEFKYLSEATGGYLPIPVGL